MMCLGIALALDTEGLSWSLGQSVNKTEQIAHIQQMYFQSGHCYFLGTLNLSVCFSYGHLR